jgi:hypothetical protein
LFPPDAQRLGVAEELEQFDNAQVALRFDDRRVS